MRTGANTKKIQQLAEFGQNLRATGPNELAIANVVALVITELQQKPAPEAYMGYALYDADSNLYEQGKIVLSKKARNKHEELIQKLAIKKDGFIETFLVNETSENIWFDQFRIMSIGPLIVQETHYDPWGVELSGLGYQYGGIKINPYLYNGKEANGHLGVNLFDYGARMYDPAIGRWFVVDPLAEAAPDWTPYRYGFNNPMKSTDPTGMFEFVQGGYGENIEVGQVWSHMSTGDPSSQGGEEGDGGNSGGQGNNSSQGTNPGKVDNCPECINMNLDPVTITAPRRFPGVLGRAADRWLANNMTNSTYGPSYGTGFSHQSEWYSGFRTFVGAGYGVINNMLMLPLSGAGYADDLLAAGSAAKGGLQYSDDLLRAAQQAYPKLAGKIQLHHITPKYLGGPANGPLIKLDAAYHQQITNAFRAEWGYGIGKPSAAQLDAIMKRVYSQFPLPK